MHELMTATVWFALIGAVVGVLIPIFIPPLFKKAPNEALKVAKEVGEVAEQLVGKGENKK